MREATDIQGEIDRSSRTLRKTVRHVRGLPTGARTTVAAAFSSVWQEAMTQFGDLEGFRNASSLRQTQFMLSLVAAEENWRKAHQANEVLGTRLAILYLRTARYERSRDVDDMWRVICTWIDDGGRDTDGAVDADATKILN